ncbi:DNA mismatch repair protein MutL [Enterovibrio norvegicus]|uniref:DNA mismatch repair endonuclease MutL n=1 Tax=Enterovibrio norvegicus TaxID=188144 RepID=UPI000300A301|nr:DNA mismatch repair endonuclease MutL [Enterovibrio norvegicus]OEE63583.1 DNA mismatch repair protein MutL [Enterovibrio norvegicus]
MAIQILPARLANQIAAGEVVERPASVVKELVENSIDAGATRIDVDIEKGGSKLIRIRDNGCGIDKGELELALSRHATSKIACLDDLEAIVSLGFRGEALASISSVSRLTLTSRTEAQTEAWSAHAEGRDMSVQIKPAAHPVGTTVEVVDLFFNTPARRKFLRTDKTEFGHIDELLKRIALSRFDVAITLRHNGTIVRQYRIAENDAQRERRLAAVCGPQFVRTAAQVSLEHQGLSLHGWICTPEGARAQNDIQHCFVNQRMMKDRLINHAIRQGYEATLKPDQFAAYVLYIDIDPHQVDVNVHPAKHEVRFHQARLVHDFIYQAVSDALQQVMADHSPSLDFEGNDGVVEPSESAHAGSEEQGKEKDNVVAEDVLVEPVTSHSKNAPSAPSAPVSSGSYSGAVGGQGEQSAWRSSSESNASGYQRQSSAFSSQGGGRSSMPEKPSAPSKATQRAYKALMQTPEVPAQNAIAEAPAAMSLNAVSVGHTDGGLGKALTIVASRYLLLQRAEGIAVLDLDVASHLHALGQMRVGMSAPGLKAQPLLIPQAIPASAAEMAVMSEYDHLLQQFGIVLRQKSASQIMVMAVCQPLRKHNLQSLIPELFGFLSQQTDSQISLSPDSLANWLARKATQKSDAYGLSQAVTLITELEHCWQGELAEHYSTLLRPVDVATAIEAFEHE